MLVKRTKFRFVVLILMFASLTLVGFTFMVFSARATDVMEIYGISQVEISSLCGVSNLGGFFFSILFGYLTDRYGVRKFPAVVFGLAALLAICRCFATSYGALWVLTFLCSACMLPASMIGPKIFAYYFEPREMATVVCVWSAGSGCGTTLAFAIAPLLPSLRACFVFLAVGTVILFALWLLLIRDPEKELRKTASVPTPNLKSMLGVLKSPTMLKIMVCGGIAMGASILINSYAVTGMLGKGMSPVAASATATAMNVTILIGGIIAGIVVDRAGRYNFPYMLLCVIGGLGFLVSYVFLPAGTPTAVGMAVSGLIFAGSIGVNMGRINLIPLTGEFGPEMVGAAGGVNQTAAGLCGWLIPVIVAAIFGDHYTGVFICAAALLVFLGLFGLCVPELGVKGRLAQDAAKKRENP